MKPFLLLAALSMTAVLDNKGAAAQTRKGLVWVEHDAIGSRSEGPTYHLQTCDKDYELPKEVFPWELDYQMEYYVRKLVEVGPDNKIVKEIQAKYIPECSLRSIEPTAKNPGKVEVGRIGRS